MRIATEIGTIRFDAAGVATPIPSTAEMTEMAGVTTPSPKSMAAPIVTTHVSQPVLAGTLFRRGNASASNARIPPSPS